MYIRKFTHALNNQGLGLTDVKVEYSIVLFYIDVGDIRYTQTIKQYDIVASYKDKTTEELVNKQISGLLAKIQKNNASS